MGPRWVARLCCLEVNFRLAALRGGIYVSLELIGVTGVKLVTLAVSPLILGNMTYVLMLRLA